MGTDLHELLRSLRVWDPAVTALPPLDPAGAPGDPLGLFTRWFAEAAEAGEREPHTMSLATSDAEGLPDARVVMLHGADADGWAFATHAGSRKGRHLDARPYAALVFYWPVLGRQVRLRGPVAAAPAEEARADLHARSTGALAAALTGRQSAELDDGRAGPRLRGGLGTGRTGTGRAGAVLDSVPAAPRRGGVLPGRGPPAPRAAGLPAGRGRRLGPAAAVAVNRAQRGPGGAGSSSVASRACRCTSRKASCRPASNIAPRRVPSAR
ncbi:Pyridoxine/pyridoxamine 5'-phosphate oxidase [Streptomyces tendae]